MGWAVSLSRDGSRAFVGVPREDTIAVDAGAARTFTRSGSTWTHEALLQHSDAVANDLCGLAIVSNAAGDRVAVGCPLDDTSLGANAGTVRVFTLASGSWSADSSISITDGQDGDQLGFSVALTADGPASRRRRARRRRRRRERRGARRACSISSVRAGEKAASRARPRSPRRPSADRSPSRATGCRSSRAAMRPTRSPAPMRAARGRSSRAASQVSRAAAGHTAPPGSARTASAATRAPCGGGVADDCQACVASLTGGTDGRCAPLDDATRPAHGVPCRRGRLRRRGALRGGQHGVSHGHRRSCRHGVPCGERRV
jgi:hypothetical protein